MARLWTDTNGQDIQIASYTAIENLDTLTIAFWAWPDGTATSCHLFQNRDGGADGHSIEWDPGDAVLLFTDRWQSSSGEWTIPEWNTDAWVHFALTYDYGSTDNDPIFYYDAVDQGAPTEVSTPAGALVDTTADWHIGNRAVGNRPFDGRLCECAVWNRVLSANEIKSVYARGVLSVPSGLVLYMPLEGLASPEPNLVTAGTLGAIGGTLNLVDHAPVPPRFANIFPHVTQTAAAPSGSTLSRDIQDAFTFTDDQLRDFDGDRLLADLSGLTDAQIRNFWGDRAPQDTTTFTDALGRSYIGDRTPQDLAGLTENQLRDFWGDRLIEDMFSFVENQFVGADVFDRLLSDSFTFTDNLSANRELLHRLQDEIATFADALNRSGVFDRTPSDVFTFSDALARDGVFAREFADVFAFVDALDKNRALLHQFADSIGFDEAIARDQVLDRLLQDVSSFNDDLAFVTTGGTGEVTFIHWRLYPWHQWAERLRRWRTWMDRSGYP